MHWYEDPSVIAKVTQAKYGFKKTYDECLEVLGEYGYYPNKKSVSDKFQAWGLPALEKSFFGSLDTERAYNYIKELLKFEPLKIKPPKKRKSHIQNILLVSDLHLPFIELQLLAEILRLKGIDIIILNGDIFDFYSISRFVSYRPQLDLKQELHDSRQILRSICESFAIVKSDTGNHFARLYKMLSKDPNIKQIMNAGLIKYKPEEFLTADFPNIEIASRHIKNSDLSVSFFDVIGKDFLYGHFEKSSKIVGKPVRDSYEAMRAWRDAFDFDFGKIKFFAQAHTHKLLQMFYDMNNVMLLETGCICSIQEYTMQPAMNYTPINQGYITFTQEDGETDPKSVKIHADYRRRSRKKKE